MKRILYNELHMVYNDLNGNVRTVKINYGDISAKKAKKKIDKAFKRLENGKIISRFECTFESGDGREKRYKYCITVDWGCEYCEYTYMTGILRY